jgi:hypothetical protein
MLSNFSKITQWLREVLDLVMQASLCLFLGSCSGVKNTSLEARES